MHPAEIRKNELFLLIRSLERHEKAYYKKMAKRYADHNQSLHLKLFELMEQSADNDEKRFARKIGIKSAAHFSGLKTYLWNDLLSALVYHKRKDPLSRLQFILLETETLLARNLIGSAARLMDLAWDIAGRHELYTIQLRLVHLQYKVLSYADHKQFRAGSARLLLQQSTLLEKLHQEQQLQILRRELIAIRQFTYLRLSEEQLARITAIRKELQALKQFDDAPLLQLLQQFCFCAATHLSYAFDLCLQHTAHIIRLWQQHPHLIAHSAGLFLACADYCFYNAFALKNIAVAEAHLALYDQMATAALKGRDQERWKIMVFHTRLKICHKTARYDQVALLMEQQAGEVLQKVKEVWPPSTALSVITSVCITYFVLEQFDKAEDLLLDVNRLNHTQQREDLLYFSAIFNLLILYEKKSFLQLSHAISATYLRLYNKKKLHPFEKDLMLFLKQLSNELHPEGRIATIRNFLVRLRVYKDDPVRELYFLYFNYYGWLESKVYRISYTEYIYRQLHRPETIPPAQE